MRTSMASGKKNLKSLAIFLFTFGIALAFGIKAYLGSQTYLQGRLCRAIYARDVQSVEAALDAGADVNALALGPDSPDKSWTLLNWALYYRFPEGALLLIERGADVNYIDDSRTVPLSIAIQQDWGQPVVQQRVIGALLRKGAKIDVPRELGRNALAHAISSSNRPAVRAIIQARADVNQWLTGELTPLMAAASCDSPENVMELLKAGANPRIKNKAGKTALDYAHEYKRLDNATILKKSLQN